MKICTYYNISEFKCLLSYSFHRNNCCGYLRYLKYLLQLLPVYDIHLKKNIYNANLKYYCLYLFVKKKHKEKTQLITE